MHNGAHSASEVTPTPSTQFAAWRQPNFQRGQPFWKNNNIRPNTTPTKFCLYYGRNGHLEHKCRTKQWEQQQQMSSQPHGWRPRAHLQELNVLELGQYDMDNLQWFTPSLNGNTFVPFNRETTEWLLDTGTTYHMISQNRWLWDYKQIPSGMMCVYLGNNQFLMVINIRNLHVTLPSGVSVTISNIYHNPGLNRNILSMTMATSTRSSIEFFHESCIIHLKLPNGEFEIIKLSKQGHLYPIILSMSNPHHVIGVSSTHSLHLTKVVSPSCSIIGLVTLIAPH
jgi:hypothetical protein